MSKIAIICAMEEELAPFRALGDHEFILVKSGVGKVHAAIAAMDVIQQGATHVIVAGVAGGIHRSLKIGDVTIAKSAIQHDVDVTALGFKPSEIPFTSRSRWDADPSLVEELLESARELKIPTWGGCVLTGDRFVANANDVTYLRQTYNGICLDMETAAVAHACFAKNVPWTAIRVISDTADEKAHKDFGRFLESSAKKTARIIERFTAIRKRGG